MHKRLIPLFTTILLALAACAAPGTDPGAPAASAPGAASSGVPDLDTSCRIDSDCEVKNVGNCCGYFPACVNREARPDPDAVMARCADTGMASVCGFRDIQSCSCVQNRCEAVHQALIEPLE